MGALVSGGLDSAVMLLRLTQRYHQVVPVYIRCGLHWEKFELYWTRKFIERLRLSRAPRSSRKLHISDLIVLKSPIQDVYGKHWSVSGEKIPGYRAPDKRFFIPARNLLLITKAAIYLNGQGIHQLAIGTLATNPFPDGQKSYFKSLSRLLSQSLKSPFQVVSPLAQEEKWELIKSSRSLPLHLTFSCANPAPRRSPGESGHCGRCNKCAERQKAFAQAGVIDPTRYKNQPKKS